MSASGPLFDETADETIERLHPNGLAFGVHDLASEGGKQAPGLRPKAHNTFGRKGRAETRSAGSGEG